MNDITKVFILIGFGYIVGTQYPEYLDELKWVAGTIGVLNMIMIIRDAVERERERKRNERKPPIVFTNPNDEQRMKEEQNERDN